LGRQLGLDGVELADLGVAARLHDIGKIGVPDSILLKRGSLNEAEQQIMRCHPTWGAETLERVPGLAGVAAAVRHHHEQWDGRGYPAGLSGEDIPLASRIIFVCDAFAAMTSTRPYRRALDVRQAVRLLVAGAGAQFDPRVVGAMCEVLDEGGVEIPEGPGAETLTVEPMLTRQPQPNAGRLARAFDRIEALPALRESRDRLLSLLADGGGSPDEVVTTIEADAALTVAVLRAANGAPGPRKGRIAGIPEAVQSLSAADLAELVYAIPPFEFFQQIPGWAAPEQARLHAVATQQVAARIARDLEAEDRDAVLVAALLHDVGKLVLSDAYPDYPTGV